MPNRSKSNAIDYTSRSVTVVEVAKRAGVSTATVSRALNDSAKVTDETKTRVRQAAEDVGYVMHRHARALRAQRTWTVSVHVPIPRAGQTGILANPFHLEFLGAIGTALHSNGIDMLVSHAASVDLGHHRVAQVDGYIQLGRGRNPSGLRDLAEAGVPLAVWAPVNPNNGFCTVGVDNVALARRAVEHLLAGGRRRIAIITADLDDETSEGFDRFEGYRQALEAAGLPQDDSLVEDLTNANHSGTAATSRLLDRHDDIDAVFAAASDSVAISVMRTLQDVGRRVPRDIGVVGFDNIQLTEFTSPRLTSIDQGLGDGAPLLVDQVMRQIDGERWQSREIPGRLVVRESTGGDLVDV